MGDYRQSRKSIGDINIIVISKNTVGLTRCVAGANLNRILRIGDINHAYTAHPHSDKGMILVGIDIAAITGNITPTDFCCTFRIEYIVNI